MTRHRELLDSELLAEHFPIFRDAEKVIADPVVQKPGNPRRLALSGRSIRRPVGCVRDPRCQLRDQIEHR